MLAARGALWVFSATLLVNLAWALSEIGLDWWQLAPRGDVSVVMGALLVLPWVVGGLRDDGIRKAGRAVLGVCLVISIGVGIAAMFAEPHDVPGRVANAAGGNGAGAPGVAQVPPGEWHAYGRTSYGQRYSPLDQITPKNVEKLDVAWTFHTGDVRGKSDPGETTYEVTPLKIGSSLYLCTPHDIVIALDAETGKEQWRFDPKLNLKSELMQHMTCRGVSYYDGSASVQPVSGDCAQRLFLPTADGRLISPQREHRVRCARASAGRTVR